MELSPSGSINNNYTNMDGSGSSSRMPLIIVLIVGLLVVVNIIITAILLGRPATPSVNVMPAQTQPAQPQKETQQPVNVNVGDKSSSQNNAQNERTYLIQYGHDYGAYEYIDAGGYHRGFFRELIEEVCTQAGVKCKPVYDSYKNCWLDEPGKHVVLGTGLQARYYDACVGWSPTIERIHIGKFTIPFLRPETAYFFAKKGQSVDSSTFVGKKVGFINGWANNEKCLARIMNKTAGIPLLMDQIVYVHDPTAMIKALDDGKIDIGVASLNEMQASVDQGLVDFDKTKPFSCTMGGDALVSRMDSDFPNIWNKGFNHIYTNGQFKKLCENAEVKHGSKGQVLCVESYNLGD